MKQILKILSCCFLIIAKSQLVSSGCPGDFVEPEQCFDLDELRDFAETARKITTLYNSYVAALTEAKFTVDDNEAGANLFYGGDLSKSVRNAKFTGGTITTFLEIAARHTCKSYDLTPEQMIYCLNGTTADFFDICELPEQLDCTQFDLTFRPIDGVCANQDNPYYGAVNTAYSRMMKNSYDDKIHEIRMSMHENSLPSARLLSTGLRTLHVPMPYDQSGLVPNDLLTFFLNQITFDIAKTLKAQTWDGNYGFECCDCNGRDTVSTRFYNHNCFPIEIPENDKHFRGKKCMNYIRALMTHDNCKLKESSILNTVTHFLDLDYIYSSDNVNEVLRAGGTFSTTDDDLTHYVISGDERNLMFPQMFAISVVFIKFHNVVFNEFHRLYPNLDNSTKFYETRRFVIALYQHVVYLEVLPTFLSPKTIQKYRLMSMKSCYDSSVDPSVTVEFVSSAFRSLHTFIQNGYILKNTTNQTSFYKLRDLSYNVTLALSNTCELFRGLMETPWNSLDIAEEPSNFLFGVNGDVGLDLRAMDIHAERDFGVATYCDALKYYNFVDEDKCIKSFKDDFKDFITNDEKLQFLKYAYLHPCDVDLGVGAGAQETDEDSILNPIFENIIGEQFQNLKCGDPYFFTNSMSSDQIDFLKQYGFNDILCLVNGNCGNMQSFVFLTPGEGNFLQPCTSVLDLESWETKVDVTAAQNISTTEPPDPVIYDDHTNIHNDLNTDDDNDSNIEFDNN